MIDIKDFDVTILTSTEDWVKLLGDANAFDPVAYLANYKLRNQYITNVGFPILTKEVAYQLRKGLASKRVIEVGCGSGYLSYTLRGFGLDITAVDTFKTLYSIANFKKRAYTDIVREDATSMDLSAFDVVIMSWPDYKSPFAYKVASNMRVGQYLIYQGESYSGCTADDDFFDLIDSSFKEYPYLSNSLNKFHVQFSGIHDYWNVYRKISNERTS